MHERSWKSVGKAEVMLERRILQPNGKTLKKEHLKAVSLSKALMYL